MTALGDCQPDVGDSSDYALRVLERRFTVAKKFAHQVWIQYVIFCTSVLVGNAMTPNANIDWSMWALRCIALAIIFSLVFFVSRPDADVTDVAGIVLIFLAIWVYFTPAIVAYRRGHLNRQAILTLNLVAGWFIVPWIIALVWAYKNDGIVHVVRGEADEGKPRRDTRTCPYCAEQIKPEAIKCRFCQSEVIPTSPG